MPRLSTLPRQLFPLYAGTIASRLGTFVVPYLTLYLSEEQGLSLSVTGRVIAAGGLGLLLGNLVGGWSADRIGRKPTLLAALVINVTGLSVLAVGLSSGTAYAAALAVALCGAGMYTPAANAWIADLTAGAQRQFAYAVNYICVNVGMGLGPLLGGLLAALSFRWLFVGDVATTLVCGVIIAFASGGRAPGRARVPGCRRADRGWATLRREAAIWSSPAAVRVLVFCAAAFFVIAPLMGMEYAVPLLVGVELGEPLVLVGLVYSINAGCILLLGLPIERRLAGRDPKLMMALAGVLWVAGLLMLYLSLRWPVLLVCTVVWTAGEIVSSVVVPTYVARGVAAAVRGRFLALPDAMRSLAGIVAPVWLGVVWEQDGVQAVLTLLVATPAIGAALFGLAWWGMRLRRRPG